MKYYSLFLEWKTNKQKNLEESNNESPANVAVTVFCLYVFLTPTFVVLPHQEDLIRLNVQIALGFLLMKLSSIPGLLQSNTSSQSPRTTERAG